MIIEPFQNVLCVSPHPDDVEFSMGNYVRQHTHLNFHIMAMSYDGAGGHVPDVDARHAEMVRFWDAFSCGNVVLTFNKGLIKQEDDSMWVRMIEDYVKEHEITHIFTTPEQDAHWEHRYVRRMVTSATRDTQTTIVEYKCASTHKDWIPNYFWEVIDEDLQLKHDALWSTMVTQRKARYFLPDVFRDFHVDDHQSRKGIMLSEQFKIVEAYG